MGADSQSNLLAIDEEGFLLQIGFPGLGRAPSGVADVVAELLAFAA